MKKMTLLSLFISMVLMLSGQKNDLAFTVSFYNVENQFDLSDHPETRDEEFTPESEKTWDLEKYEKKLYALLNKEPGAKIIIMGDLNDEPTDRSVFEMLLANNKRKNAGDRELYNLMYEMHNLDGVGSYNYHGTWNMLDQISVSRTLFKGPGGWHCNHESGRLLKEEFMMYFQDDNRQYVPTRIYGGSEYFGGISDHLPVFVTLTRD
jgi:hypothetical protein